MTKNGSTWTPSSALTPPGVYDWGWSGVSASLDGTALYVTANGGVYGFSVSSASFWPNGPLVKSQSSGAGLTSVYRGIALSPVTASPTSTAVSAHVIRAGVWRA